jgi:uncharacterized membrane protein
MKIRKDNTAMATIEVLLPLSNDFYTKVKAINNQGVAVGSSGSLSGAKGRPVLWKESKPEMLTLLPGYVGGAAVAILADAHIVGTVWTRKDEKQAGIWAGKKFAPLQTLRGCNETEAIAAAGSYIVGYSRNAKGESLPTLWKNGMPVVLTTPTSYSFEVKNVSENGFVIGTAAPNTVNAKPHANDGIVWQEGKIIFLDHGGYRDIYLNSINAKGEIVGSVRNWEQTRAAYWSSLTAKCTSLPPQKGTAIAIGQNGSIVGAVFSDMRRATLWEDGKSIALNTLLPKKSPFLELDAAYCISEDSKYIAGLGTDARTANFASYRLRRP